MNKKKENGCASSRSKMQNVRLSLGLLFLIANFSGCATVKEGAKGILGISTKQIEDARDKATSKKFSMDLKTCEGKVIKALERGKAYIYAKDPEKKLIAVYISYTDTTPVGIFFKVIDAENTLVEVSSPSTYGKEIIAKKIFSALERPLTEEGDEAIPEGQLEDFGQESVQPEQEEGQNNE